ncbi:LysR family transcriptional regulator [Parvibaculum sp.]|uniref:LysR family transcriptional regulator n=1 Tax=Parvibaculum sp. TaxID=2024848 RepID=UPI001DCC3F5B|nr:LysR family transcriptional regulator [Parvibaculum sp.]MBX3491150.1 LysR family transcriptional regulator [Parvibaculum sp.]MCW5728970.1 LysR family transcriptional regulator [Parvibaculum sp.]
MDSDALQTFVTIHRAGGFSPAAEALHRSQPAISRRIALLEEELGVPLFERVTGGVTLSQAGRALLPYAERVLAALQDAGDAVADLRSGAGGPIALATVGTLASTGLTRVLKRFASKAPGVRLTVRTATSAEVSELVRSGAATIGLRYFDDPAPHLDCFALRPEPLVIACAPSHPRAGKRVRALTELRGERWLALPQTRGFGEPSAQTIFAEFRIRGVAAIDWTAIDSLTAQKRLAEAGFGIALLPESSIAEERAAGSLAVIRADDLKVANPVTAITRKGGYLSAASRKLLEILKADFRG